MYCREEGELQREVERVGKGLCPGVDDDDDGGAVEGGRGSEGEEGTMKVIRLGRRERKREG